jgi:cytochrome c oxidase subunit 2
MWFKTTKPATYVGQCAELCGRNHANMFSRVVAVPFPEYQRWYDRQAAAIEAAQQEAPEQREALEQAEGEQAVQGGGSAGGATDDQ